MKNLINYITLVGLALVLMASNFITDDGNEPNKSSGMPAGHMVLDEASSIIWEGSKIVGGKHIGTIAMKESSLLFNGTELIGGSFVMDMTSIKNTDLDGGSAKKLEGHLKSEDFFGVSKYPTSKFTISNVKPGEEADEYHVTGDLTIKSTTLPITFPVVISWDSDRAIAEARISVDRADFDVRYGSGRFFDGLGNRAIKDEFTLDVTIVSEVVIKPSESPFGKFCPNPVRRVDFGSTREALQK
jgi:polyisoprenoid-binding protein YceI